MCSFRRKFPLYSPRVKNTQEVVSSIFSPLFFTQGIGEVWLLCVMNFQISKNSWALFFFLILRRLSFYSLLKIFLSCDCSALRNAGPRAQFLQAVAESIPAPLLGSYIWRFALHCSWTNICLTYQFILCRCDLSGLGWVRAVIQVSDMAFGSHNPTF